MAFHRPDGSIQRRRLFLGSVSNYVVKNSDLTVIVVSGDRSED